MHPDWKIPTVAEARAACDCVPLHKRHLGDPAIGGVIDHLRETRANGGALFASFHLEPHEVFDWFPLTGRLLMYGLLRQLLSRPEATTALEALAIRPFDPNDPAYVVYRLQDLEPVPVSSDMYGINQDTEFGNADFDGTFRPHNSFQFAGALAEALFGGGAYHQTVGHGKLEQEESLAFCNALFGGRFSEVSVYSTRDAWTPWFSNMGLDWTAVLFDRRERWLSVLAVTDSD